MKAPKGRIAALLLAAVIFPAFCLPLVFSTYHGNFDSDESTYYLPSVSRISQHWPALHLSEDAMSATSPGYPYLLATARNLTGLNRTAFRLITLALSSLLLVVLARMFGPGTGSLAALAIAPLALSNFFVKSASWIVTDNVALLFVCLALGLVRAARPRPARMFWAGMAAAAAVLVRQLHGWLLVPIALRAFPLFFGEKSQPHPARGSAAAGFSLLAPVSVALWMLGTWGGLVPPQWQESVGTGIYPASVACALVVFLPLGLLYFLAVEPVSSLPGLARTPWALVGGAAGLLCALASTNAANRADGHWGGYFWFLVEHTPSVAHRSLLIIACAPLGGALIGAMAFNLRNSTGVSSARFWLGSVASWLAACALNKLAFQRYFEPPILVFLIFWLICKTSGENARHAGPYRIAPLVLLAAAQFLITLITAYLPALSGA